MRRLAAGIAGVVALALMAVMQPWGRLGCDPENCSMSQDLGGVVFYAIALLMYLVVPLLVVGIIQVAVLGIRDSSQPHDQAVLAALGQTRGSATRAAARRGLVDGAVWVGGAYVLAGAVHLAVNAYAGWPPFATEAELWWGRAVVGALVVATLAVAHLIDAARPHRTPVEQLYVEAEAPQVRRSQRALGLGLAIVAAAASGVVVGLALAYDLAPSFFVTNAAGIALIVAWVAVLLLGLLVVVPASRLWVPRWLGWVARVSGREVAPIVRARASSASRASGRLVLVLGSGAFLLGAGASVDPSPELSSTYVGYRTILRTHDSQDFAQRMREVEGVAAVLVPPMRNVVDAYGMQRLMFAVDPDQLRGLDEPLADILAANPTVLVQTILNGTAQLHVAGSEEYGFTPSGVIPIATCCEVFTSDSSGMPGSSAETAYLIYSTDPALNAEVAADVWAIAPHHVEASYSEGAGGPHGTTGVMWSSWLVSGALLAVLVGVPMIALAAGLVRARRRDDATLAALGSSAQSLRAALVIETVAVSAFAVLVGGGFGALVRASMTAVQRSRASLTGVITDSYLATAWGSVAWTALAIALAGTIVVMGGTAWFVASRHRGATPVEGLMPQPIGGNAR